MILTHKKTLAMGTSRVARVAMALVLACVMGVGMYSVGARAQTFSSGSDESDGAFALAANLGTVVFDPTDTARWGRVLDEDGDGVYNFTTINIAAGTTLRIAGDRNVRPVYWLASGGITISGTLDLRGAAGPSGSDIGIRRTLAVPGAGGFAGGAGGLVGGAVPPTPGDGPGGGPGTFGCVSGGDPRRCGSGGTFTTNRYLLPLLGGSGGAGGLWNDGVYRNGGAGGGAILLASSTSVTISGSILVNGGTEPSGIAGAGSGGAIRLAAPTMTVTGNGTLDVRGGTGSGSVGSGSAGMIRLERFTQSGTFTTPAGTAFLTVGSPVDSASLRPSGMVRVTAVAGVAVPANAAGSFTIPDVTISSAVAVPVEIEAIGVPPGTVVTLQVYPQTPDDTTVINLPAVQTTLTGTVEHSTATINFVFPYGFSRGTLRATW